MSIIDDLNWRYACKEFDSTKKLTDEQFNNLLEALRLTPSSFGMQPWKFVVVEDIKLREELVAASWNQNQVKDASHLIVLCAPIKMDEEFVDRYIKSTADARGQEISELKGFKDMLMKLIVGKDPESYMKWARNQIYIALGNLMTVCANMRIDCCPMEGFQPKKFDEILGLEAKGLTTVLVAPVGFRSESDKYTKLAKSRFDQSEVVIKI